MRILAINFKAYKTAFTDTAVKIAEAASKAVTLYNNLRVILAVPSPLVYILSSIHEDLYLQHVDPVEYGSRTGYLPARALEHLPVKGTLLNHSEHKMTIRHIDYAIKTIREIGKEILVCADTPQEAAALTHLKPNMIAVEPPELIGTGIPVSRAKPEVITKAVDAVHRIDSDIPVLAGAGISGPEDAVKAVELGAKGVLVASVVMKSKTPKRTLIELAEALSQ
ncbi:MAG: triose-phosphate isomerase [Desulfurococcales archaeon]|nr:triose-phosphate isomerase [Desulfurococcales archaeon]